MTRDEVIREFHRLCRIVNEAEASGLLDMDQALAMRERYRDRADAVLNAHKQIEKVRS